MTANELKWNVVSHVDWTSGSEIVQSVTTCEFKLNESAPNVCQRWIIEAVSLHSTLFLGGDSWHRNKWKKVPIWEILLAFGDTALELKADI